MPRRPKKPCSYPSCPALVEAGQRFCSEHKRENYRNDNRKNYRERGYSNSWDKVKAIKKRQDPLCEMCRKENRITAVEIVHHIKPINEGGELLDMDNLMSVCRVCHGRLHSKG